MTKNMQGEQGWSW